jgi:hypothetical protein
LSNPAFFPYWDDIKFGFRVKKHTQIHYVSHKAFKRQRHQIPTIYSYLIKKHPCNPIKAGAEFTIYQFLRNRFIVVRMHGVRSLYFAAFSAAYYALTIFDMAVYSHAPFLSGKRSRGLSPWRALLARSGQYASRLPSLNCAKISRAVFARRKCP